MKVGMQIAQQENGETGEEERNDEEQRPPKIEQEDGKGIEEQVGRQMST